MNVAHAVIPLEDYNKMKKSAEDSEARYDALAKTCVLADRLQEAVFRLINPQESGIFQPQDILETCGLQIVVDGSGTKNIIPKI